MSKVRVIMMSNEAKEAVVFSKDLDENAEDYIIPGYTLDSDTIIENNLPIMFPFDETLIKQ